MIGRGIDSIRKQKSGIKKQDLEKGNDKGRKVLYQIGIAFRFSWPYWFPGPLATRSCSVVAPANSSWAPIKFMELQLARTLPHVDELVSWLFRGLERKRSENQGHGVLGKTCVLMSSPDIQMGLCVWPNKACRCWCLKNKGAAWLLLWCHPASVPLATPVKL